MKLAQKVTSLKGADTLSAFFCREQLLEADVDWLDGVLITHEHADHTHGIDDLRPLFVHKRRRVDVHLDEATSRAMHARFGYCFMTPPRSEYPPILSQRRLVPGQASRSTARRFHRAVPCCKPRDIPSLRFRFAMWPIRPTSRACRRKACRS